MIIDIFSVVKMSSFPPLIFVSGICTATAPHTVFPRNTCETQEAVVPFQESEQRKCACKEPLLMHIRANLSVFTY